MQDYICIETGAQADIDFLTLYAANFGLATCSTCKAGYFCVGIGTGAMADVHTANLEGYATSHGLPHEKDSF